MQLTNKAKIALGLAIVLIIAGAWLFFASRKSPSDQTPSESATPYDPYAPSTEPYAPSPVEGQSLESGLPIELLQSQVAANQSPGASVTPGSSSTASAAASTSKVAARTPASTVDINGLRHYKVTVTPAPNAGKLDWTVTDPEIEIIDAKNSPYFGKSACEIAGFKNSWSNMFEKIACDGVNFITDSMIEPLAKLACSFYATGLQQNRGDNITSEYRGGACLIIDR